MSLRQIIVVSSTTSAPKVLRSEAETWGQLKDGLRSDYGDLGKMRAVVKETKATLELDDAELPEGDFTLFLSAKQIKAGQVDVVAVLERLKEEYVESIDNIISDINDGDYQKAESRSSGYTPKVTREDQDILSQLSRM